MKNLLKNVIVLFVLLLANLNVLAQDGKTNMNSYKLPFTWILQIKAESDIKVENMIPTNFRVDVKNNFIVKIDVGLNITSKAFDGNVAERMSDNKDIMKSAADNGHTISYLEETNNSFIKCDKDNASSKSTYMFYGYLIDGDTDYDFVSTSYPEQTLENCTALSNAFKTITFTTTQVKTEPVSVKLFTNHLSTEIKEGDTLNSATLLTNEINSRLSNNLSFNKYDVLRIGVYVISDVDKNKTNEDIFSKLTPLIEKQYNLKKDGTFTNKESVDDVIEAQSGTTYFKKSAYGYGLYQTIKPIKSTLKIVTIITAYNFESPGQFKANKDGSYGKI
ncbi:MAG: hypothetical protein ABI207_01205, partial [Crocinitomicaceae bacterium]